MSPPRPSIEPGLLARLSEAAPARLARTLDKDPELAERWFWEPGAEGSWQVKTEGGQTVELRPGREGRIEDEAQVRCSCLLAPRCLHLLAVLTRLPLDEEGPRGTVADVALAVRTPDQGSREPLTAEQARAVISLEHGAAELLEVGVSAAGVRLQAELLRAVHDARCSGLYRAAAAGTRLVRGCRDLRETRPEFKLGTYAADLLELLEVTRVLGLAAEAAASVPSAWLGLARRSYHEVGHLRLHGLFCEPVLAGSGASGVQTTLVDEDGRLYSVSDVQPGEPARARGTYERGVRLGETSLSHRQLCREGLFVQGATVSSDGRLGSGASVRAVRAEGTPWDAAPIARLFAAPLAGQLCRVYASLDLPRSERPAGSSLLFLQGQVLGASGPVLLVGLPDESEGVTLRCWPAHDHAELGIQAVLRLLARTPGLHLRLIGELRPEQPSSLALLAIGPVSPPSSGSGSAPALELPMSWSGRCNLGLDPLQASHLRGLQALTVEVQASGTDLPDPLSPLRRRWQRLALGGRSTLPPEAGVAVEREARWLDEHLLRSGGALLRQLLAAALSGERTLTGERGRVDAERLGRAYLAVGLYQRACARNLEEQAWLEPLAG